MQSVPLFVLIFHQSNSMKQALINQIRNAILLCDLSASHLHDEISKYRDELIAVLVKLEADKG